MSPRQRRIVLTLSLACFGFLTAIDPHALGTAPDSLWNAAWFGSVLFGQPCLLAIWAAFHRQPWAIRLPWTLGLSAVQGLLLAWSQRHSPNALLRSGLFTCVLTMGVFLSCAIVLTVLRWRRGWRIDTTAEPPRVLEATHQFSLRQLLTWTAATAAILATIRCLGSEKNLGGTFLEYVGVWGQLGAPCLLWLVPSIGYALSRTSQRRFVVWAHLMAAVGITIQYRATPFHLRVEDLVSLDLGYALTIAAGLGVLRLCGYQLLRGTTAIDREDIPCSPDSRGEGEPSP